MKFFDMHVSSNNSVGESSIEEIGRIAETLGYGAVCIADVFHSLEKIKEIKKVILEAQKNTTCELVQGVEIRAKNPQEMRKLVSKARELAPVLIVYGGDYKINRAACENPKVDIIAHPELGRSDSGLDEACLKSAAKSGVAMEINFLSIVSSFRKERAYVLDHISQNISLCKKFKVGLVISSGARSVWGMRSPRDLASLGSLLGLEEQKSVRAISDIPSSILEDNLKKLSGKSPSRGVEVV